MAQRICSTEGCGKPHKAFGLCNAEYLALRKSRATPDECSFGGCDLPQDSRGYCGSHARQDRQGKELHPLRTVDGTQGCLVEGCDGKHVGLGLCNRDLLRLRIHGDVNHVRRPEDAPRKYTLDTAFFDEIDTEAKAYWLGFVTADGSVTRTGRTNSLRVGLAIKDTAHLERMNADLGSNRPLAFWLNRPHPAVTATFDSWQLVQGLRSLGVHPNKSGTVEPWDGPEELMSHYWRGLFDGDGSIFRVGGKASWTVDIAGSEPCVRAFAAWAQRICGSTATPRRHRGRTWHWRVGGGEKPQLVTRALYVGSTVYLDRKYELAGQLLAITFPGKHLFGIKM